MAKQKTNANFLIQGSILAFAGILVRVIGVIYRIPLNNILGNEGAGYYSTAYDIYSILLLLSSQSMPLAVSKLVSASIAKHEYKNSYRLFKGALIYAVVAGLIFGGVAYFGADFLAGLYNYPSASRALKVLAPTLLIVSVIGVFRGYFQGMGQMVPTAISQVFEQIVNAIVSVVAAYQLYAYGKSIEAASLKASVTNASSYGAAGGTLGTCMGAFGAFIVLVFIFARKRPGIRKDISNDRAFACISYKTVAKLLIITITPVLVSTTIYQIGNLVDNAIYGNLMQQIFHMEESVRASYWGIYSAKFKLLTTMPIAIASAMAVSVVPSLTRSYTEKNYTEVRRKIHQANRFTMIIALPCGVGLSVLGGPVNLMLYPGAQEQEMTARMMLFSVFTVTAFSLSTISNSILQGIDRLKVPIINSGIALVLHLLMLPVLLIWLKTGIYGIVIGDFLFAFLVCLFNARSIKKYAGYSYEVKDTFLKPLLSSVVMGVCAVICYFLFDKIFLALNIGKIAANDISAVIAIAVAAVLYFIILIKIKGITREEIESFPKGDRIVRILQKMRLL